MRLYFIGDFMEPLKVIDFDHGLGGFTTGLEVFDEAFEVIEAPWLNSNTNLCYNVNHKNWFEPDRTDFDFNDTKFDVAVFNPNFGDGFQRRGASNFSMKDIDKSISLIKEILPKFAIITTRPDILPFMCSDEALSRTVDGWPIYDRVLSSLDGYNLYQFTIDGADYGIPQHKTMNFYFCIRGDVMFHQMRIPDVQYSRKRGFITIEEAIGDINKNNYSDFKSKYINLCRRHNPKLTWHNLDYRKKDLCACVAEGSSAKKTSELAQKTGYIRPRYDRICPNLYSDFYLLSSKGPSLHPIEDRPFSHREGARLFGLPDTFVWNESMKKKDVAKQIYDSVSPVFGIVLGQILLNGLQPP